jgi:hypothetical protein
LRHIVIAVPAYTGTVHYSTMRSLIADLLALVARGDRFTLLDDINNTLIPDARAIIMARFLGLEDATDLVYVDHDVAWEPGALLRLLDHPVAVVAGVYPRRADPLSFPVRWIAERAELWADPETGLLEVEGVPGGFLRVRRDVAQAMADAYPNLEFYVSPMDDGSERAPGHVAWALFEPCWSGKAKLSEDLSFCRRWRDLGGSVWVDPEIRMAHTGIKSFTGSLGDWLRGRVYGAASSVRESL